MREFGRTRAQWHTIGALMWVASTQAAAHTGTGPDGLALAGLMHPFTGIDHLFTTVGLGLLVTRLDRRVGWQLSAGFFAGMVVGIVARYVNVECPGTELWLALGMCLVGGLLSAVQRPAPAKALIAVASGLALLHGYVHADELAPSPEQWPTALGFLVGSGVLLGLGGVLGSLTRCWGSVSDRVLGSVSDRVLGAVCLAMGAIAAGLSV